MGNCQRSSRSSRRLKRYCALEGFGPEPEEIADLACLASLAMPRHG